MTFFYLSHPDVFSLSIPRVSLVKTQMFLTFALNYQFENFFKEHMNTF